MNRPLCIIPARGGSKRVPRKNIRPLAGLPLIAHSIRTAQASDLFEAVIVSTDDAEIAAIARGHGAQTPFVRAAELAGDHAGTAEVIADAIHKLDAEQRTHICCFYPTAPLIETRHLREAHSLICNEGSYSVITVTDFDFPPMRAYRLTGDGHLAFNWPEHELTRSQDLPHLVHDAGAFYWLSTQPFLERMRLTGPTTLPYALDRLSAADIDTEDDFRFAEMLYELRRRQDGSAGH